MSGFAPRRRVKGRGNPCLLASSSFFISICLAALPGTGACPRRCACYVPTEVHCTFRYLTALPDHIPPNVERINLGYNSVVKLTEKNFLGLNHLELLMLHSNAIHTIPDKVFTGLPALQVLKMSYNKVRKLHKDTFYGLKSLIRLHMDHNNIEFINPEAFHGLSALRLVHLEGNFLTKLHPDTFVSLRFLQTFPISFIKHIYLSDNFLTSLPQEMVEQMPDLESLYLHGNPWICDCGLEWFPGWMERNPDVVKCKRDRNSSASQQCPVCKNPWNSKDRLLAEIPASALVCTKPVIDPTLKLRNTSLSEEGDSTPASPKEFLAPIGSMDLNMADHSGNEAKLVCDIQKPSIKSPISLLRENDLSLLNVSFSTFLICNIDSAHIQTLWRILALYSVSPLRMERSHLLTETPHVSYKYKQVTSKSEDIFTDIEAEVGAEPTWLMQDHFLLQLDRTATTLSTLHIRFWTEAQITLPPVGDGGRGRYKWTAICRDNSTKLQHTVLVGETVDLNCPGHGDPAPHVEWVLADGSRVKAPYVSEDGRILIDKAGKLELQTADRFDAGLYHCISTNYGDADVLTYRVIMVEPDLGDRHVNGVRRTVILGETIDLPCQSTGVPDASVSWVLPGPILLHRSSRNKHIFSNGTLRVQRVTPRDGGLYRCVAANPYGVDFLTFRVSVESTGNAALTRDDGETDGSGQEEHKIASKVTELPPERTDGTSPPATEPVGRNARKGQPRSRMTYHHRGDYWNRQFRGHRRQFPPSIRRIDPQRWAAFVEKTKKNSPPEKPDNSTSTPMPNVKQFSKDLGDGEGSSGVSPPEEEFLLPVTKTLTISANTSTSKPTVPSGNNKANFGPVPEATPAGSSWLFSTERSETATLHADHELSPSVTAMPKKTNITQASLMNGQELMKRPATTFSSLLTNTGEFRKVDQMSASLGKRNERYKKPSEELVEETIKDIHFEKSHVEDKAELLTDSSHYTSLSTVSRPRDERLYFLTTQKTITPSPLPGSTITAHHQIQVINDLVTTVPMSKHYGRRRKISGRRRIIRPNRIPNIRERYNFARLQFKGFAEERTTFLPTTVLDRKCSSCTSGPTLPPMPIYSVTPRISYSTPTPFQVNAPTAPHDQSTTLPTRPASPTQVKMEPNLEVEKPTPTIRFFYAESTQVTPQNDSVTNAPISIHTEQIPSTSISGPMVIHTSVSAIWETAPVTSSYSVESANSLTSAAQPTVRASRRKIPWHHIFVHSPVQKETINSHKPSSLAGITPGLSQITPVQSTVGAFHIHLKTISTRQDQTENFLLPTRATVAHDNLLERHSPRDTGIPVERPSPSLTPHLASSTADSSRITFPSLPHTLATVTQTPTARSVKQKGQRRKRPQKRITTAQSMTSTQSPAFAPFGTTSPSMFKMVRTLMLPPIPEYSPSPPQGTSGVPVKFSPPPVSLHRADVTREISRVTTQPLKTNAKMAGPRKPLEVSTPEKSTFTLPATPQFLKDNDHIPAMPPIGTLGISIGYPEQPSTLISDTTRAGLPQTSRVDTLQLLTEVPPDSRSSPNTKSPAGTTLFSNTQHLGLLPPLVTVPPRSWKDKTATPRWSNKFEHKPNSEIPERGQTVRENTVTVPKSSLPATSSLHTLGQEREKVDSIGSSFDQAANQEITGSHHLTLDSLPRKRFEKPRIIGGKAASFTVLVNSDAFIPCEASGTPHPTIYWSRGSLGLIIASGRQEGRFQVFANGTLSIQATRVQDRGQYLCVAVNPQGSDRLLVTLSVVTYPPRILDSRTREITVHVGSSAEVSCRAEGRPLPTRSWILANKTVIREASEGSRRVSVKPDGTLVVRSLTVYDRGVYTCLARNPAGMDSLSVKIQVIAAPPLILEEKRQHVVGTWGGSLKLPCTVEGNPQPTVHWVLSDGTKVKPLQLVNARWFLLANGTLYTQNLALSDSGRYECIATSSTGSERRVVNLMIERRDSVPSIETASPKLTELNLGDPLFLNCSATGTPEPRIIWRLPSRAVIDRWHRMGSRIHVFPNGSLVIRAVTDKDAGDYLCVARNKMGEDLLLMKVILRMKAAQIDHKQHFKKQVPYGKDFRVDCKASGSPVPEISWSLPDGTMVNNVMQADDSGHRSRRYVLFDNGTLYFNKVGMAEEGDYTCYAQNTLGKDEMKVHLTVVTPAPQIRQSPKSYQRVRAGETVILDCEVMGEPSPKIFWLLPSSDKVSSSSDRYLLHTNGSLSISKVKLLDSGEYVCVARNSGGDDTKLYKLDVISRPPAINSWYANKTVIKTTAVRHSKKHIDCRAEGMPPPQIMWIMPDHIFLTAPYYGSRITVHPNGTLEIRNVRSSDTAEFTCVARNDGGESVLVVQLEVLEMLRRPTFRNPFNEKVIALPGTPTALNCSVIGNPPPEIIWLLPNGTQFPARAGNARFHIRSNGSLVIQNPTKDDAGRYRCTAKNQVGYIEKLIILEVAQKPVILTYVLEAIKGISGQLLSLHCVSSGSPKPTVTWTVPGGRVIDRSHAWGRYILHENGTLVIQEATVHDRGNYICKAKNSIGVATVAVPVTIVAYAPRITNRPPRSIHTVSGVAVQLNCVALGIPKPEITWEMPDHSVLSTAGGGRSSGSELLHPRGTLVIQNPQTSDSGVYKCTAKNQLGWDSAMTYIRVH